MNGKVKLKSSKVERDFDFEHALALLRLQSKTGRTDWQLSDKNWKFEKNELIRSKKAIEETEK